VLLTPGGTFRRAGLMAGLAAALAQAQGPPAQPRPEPQAGFRIEHTAPACLLSDRSPRLVACLQPRSSKANLRVVFRAEDGADEYSTALVSDSPCYSGVLPRPSRSTARVTYRIEARGAGFEATTAEHQTAVVAEASACSGTVAPVANRPQARVSWEGPPGAPRTPPGFEGTPAASAPRVARTPTSPPRVPASPVSPPVAAPGKPSPGPKPAGTSPPPPAAPPAKDVSGGHGLRNALIVGAGAAAAGGAVAVAQGRKDPGGPAATLGTGLPPTGASGVYVGIETVNYPGGCVGTDDVVLNLQESGGSVSGVLTFTVRSCPCCSIGRGANAVSGSLSGTSLGLSTPGGFNYSGTFAGNRITGALAAPGGITGTWSVDKR
jgi:hypothetical protein